MFALRPYQTEAVESVLGDWQAHRTCLVVLPTGMGKTRVASEIIARSNGRCLFLAHREELITQAKAAIERDSGLRVSIEKASTRASLAGTDVVIASVQTLKGPRLKRWPVETFETIIIDEAHRAIARTYQTILNHFATAKVLCITATPDRSDKLSLSAVVDQVSYVVEMYKAIEDGWLCPLRIKQVNIADMDLSNVRTKMGDLSEQDLEQMLGSDQLLHLIAQPLAHETGSRPTLVFTPGVQSAHQLAKILSSYVGASKVASLDGNSAKDDRSRIISDYREGRIQYLVNCQLLTEGFDAPHTACVAMARPTKSRALYAQAVGRGTRIAPGKTDLLVLDFKGAAGRHKLVNPTDILGGKTAPEVVERVAKLIEAGESMDVLEALKAEQDAIAKERLLAQQAAQDKYKLLADVRYTLTTVDPFDVVRDMIGHTPEYADHFMGRASESQIRFLQRFNLPFDSRLSKRSASKMIDKMIERRQAGLCTYKQAEMLAKWGMSATVSFPEATAIMTRAKANGWRPTRDDWQKYRRQE